MILRPICAGSLDHGEGNMNRHMNTGAIALAMAVAATGATLACSSDDPTSPTQSVTYAAQLRGTHEGRAVARTGATLACSSDDPTTPTQSVTYVAQLSGTNEVPGVPGGATGTATYT